MGNDIEFIGTAADAPGLSREVSRLLSTGKIGLSYGSDFMGRPGTQVYSCERHVVKLRGELSLKEAVARRWCLRALEREHRFAVHHPGKAWFLVGQGGGDGGDVGIGNICPRLAPLHSLFRLPPASQAEREGRLGWLSTLLEMELRLNREEATRLDLGLSNFGLDAEGRLYYLDDDFYSADGWVALAQTLGVWLRSHAWIDEAFAGALGAALRRLMLALFADPHCLTVLAEQLRGLFMPNPARYAVLAALVGGLVGGQPSGVSPAAVAADRAVRPRQRYFALLADVHANLPALEAALAFLDREGIRDGLVLGDFVGYGPHPVECVERLRDGGTGLALLRGNHDHAAATGLCEQGFGNSARWCVEWSMARLDEGHKAWLLSLPAFLEGEGWLAVHGAPVDPTFFNAYVYQMTYAQNLDVLQRRGIALCFHGHTHMQGVYARDARGGDALLREKTVSLAGFRHCLVCPGSVGQPRNRESGAQLAVLDWESRELRFFTLPYDVESTVRDMEQAGFPSGLSKRLLAGV
jgi:predicted phosphodiesterase